VDIPMGVTGLLGEGGLYQCRIRLPSYEILSMALSLSLYVLARSVHSQKVLRSCSEKHQKTTKDLQRESNPQSEKSKRTFSLTLCSEFISS